MKAVQNPPSRRETTISWFIMGILAVIAVGVFIKQSDYNADLFIPSILEPQAPGKVAPNSLTASGFAGFVPAGMGVMSPVESFGPETLSEKIDGKAELYLSAGFLSLRSQRFVSNAEPQSWMEIFVYDMGTLRRAFAVYSAQKRVEAEFLDLTPFSYRTKNAVFCVHGRYYVEIIASVPSEIMLGTMIAFAENFVRKTSVEGGRIDELAFFPREHLIEESIVLFITNAFGFDGLENVFSARYEVAGGESFTAFLSQQKSAREAERLVQAYHTFLLKNGGTDVPGAIRLPGAALVRVLDTFELIFHQGRYVAGVHEAQSQEAAEKMALMLGEKLAEAIP